MATSNEPNRVYLYDLTNNRPIVDYYLDATNVTDPKKSKYVFSGIINKEEVTNGRGLIYKFRITNQKLAEQNQSLVKEISLFKQQFQIQLEKLMSQMNTATSEITEVVMED